MKLTLLCGSFNAKSRTLQIAHFLQKTYSEHSIQIPVLTHLPFYCEDLDRNHPEPIRIFLEHIQQTDGLICISPEYNHSIPAVLKNAIDWASRPAFTSILKDKPVTFITQADSPVGGARAQAHLKLVMDATLSLILPAHEMMIGSVSTLFNAQQEITAPQVRTRMLRHVDAFITFIQSQPHFLTTD